MRTPQEPAHSIIKLLGGEAVVAEITKRAITAPYRWQQPISKRGTGGLIPQKHHPRLLEYARQIGANLSPADFLASPPPGATPATGNAKPLPAATPAAPDRREAAE